MGIDIKFDRKSTGSKKASPRKRGDTDHVRLIPPGTLFCMHCGESYSIALPAPISMIASMTKTFADDHAGCTLDERRGLACTFCLDFGHERFACPRLSYDGDPMRWLAGPDTGSSSEFLCRTLAKMPQVDRVAVPHDPDDFGRCHRLLAAIPGWRERIGEMAVYPEWKPLVEAWDELESLYLEELPSGMCMKTHERMKQLSV